MPGGKLDDLGAALHLAGRVGRNLAVFRRDDGRKSRDIALEQFAEPVQDASPTQRRRRRPLRKRRGARRPRRHRLLLCSQTRRGGSASRARGYKRRQNGLIDLPRRPPMKCGTVAPPVTVRPVLNREALRHRHVMLPLRNILCYAHTCRYSCAISSAVGMRGLFCGEPGRQACAAITGMASKYFCSEMPYCFGEGTCSSRFRR